MKKIKTLLLTLVATFAFWCAPVYAETTSAGGYTITKYNVDIDVHENNVLDITEDITVYFTEYRHGSSMIRHVMVIIWKLRLVILIRRLLAKRHIV